MFRIDIVPDVFDLIAEIGVEPGAIVVSAPVTITDIDVPVQISVEAGEYSLGCNGTFTALPGNVGPGQEVCVRLVAPDATDSVATATLSAGGVPGKFKATTRSARTPRDGSPGPGEPPPDPPATPPEGNQSPGPGNTLGDTSGGAIGFGALLPVLLAGRLRRRRTQPFAEKFAGVCGVIVR